MNPRHKFLRLVITFLLCFVLLPTDGSAASRRKRKKQRVNVVCGTRKPSKRLGRELTGLFQLFRFTGALDDQTQRQGFTALAAKEIPVLFHVIYDGSANDGANVSDAVLEEQLAVLNRAYSGEEGGAVTPYRFVLQGISRHNNKKWRELDVGSTNETAMKRALHAGGPGTLNIYVTTAVRIAEGKLLAGRVCRYSTGSLRNGTAWS